MKSYLICIVMLLACTSVFAQRKMINYQAVIMEQNPTELPGNNIPSQPLVKGKIMFRFTLLDGYGKLEYTETQACVTDEFGMVNLNIGIGEVNNSGVSSTNVAAAKFKNFDDIIWDDVVK